jgi:hypothetical protein
MLPAAMAAVGGLFLLIIGLAERQPGSRLIVEAIMIATPLLVILADKLIGTLAGRGGARPSVAVPPAIVAGGSEPGRAS